MKDLGDTLRLSIDCLFKGCGDHFNYQWSVEGEKIKLRVMKVSKMVTQIP